MPRDSGSQKQAILDYCQEKQLKKAGLLEIRAIADRLAQQFGARKRSLSYIVQVLRAAGVAVGYENRYLDPITPEPYASELRGKLKFGDFVEAEASLRSLDAALRSYSQAGDRTGVSLVRALALRGRQRAEGLAGSSRVHVEKRQEKSEIARWFAVWLQTPEIFFDWLEMRRQSEEFRRKFGSKADASASLET